VAICSDLFKLLASPIRLTRNLESAIGKYLAQS
jgi:hypothetical protein